MNSTPAVPTRPTFDVGVKPTPYVLPSLPVTRIPCATTCFTLPSILICAPCAPCCCAEASLDNPTTTANTDDATTKRRSMDATPKDVRKTKKEGKRTFFRIPARRSPCHHFHRRRHFRRSRPGAGCRGEDPAPQY